MLNIKLTYLYRDGGNYKRWAEVIFPNPDGLSTESITKALRDGFLPDGLFIARQIRVPEVFFYTQGDAASDDHCFHEFGGAELTAEAPNDRHSRSIAQFITEVRTAAKQGWAVFDPHEGPVPRISN